MKSTERQNLSEVF